jgi:Homeodomain-like domain
LTFPVRKTLSEGTKSGRFWPLFGLSRHPVIRPSLRRKYNYSGMGRPRNEIAYRSAAQLRASGHTWPSIARALSVSLSTVERWSRLEEFRQLVEDIRGDRPPTAAPSPAFPKRAGRGSSRSSEPSDPEPFDHPLAHYPVTTPLDEELADRNEVLLPVVDRKSALYVISRAISCRKIRKAVLAMSARPRGMINRQYLDQRRLRKGR